jgi:hypothetical protein
MVSPAAIAAPILTVNASSMPPLWAHLSRCREHLCRITGTCQRREVSFTVAGPSDTPPRIRSFDARQRQRPPVISPAWRRSMARNLTLRAQDFIAELTAATAHPMAAKQ